MSTVKLDFRHPRANYFCVGSILTCKQEFFFLYHFANVRWRSQRHIRPLQTRKFATPAAGPQDAFYKYGRKTQAGDHKGAGSKTSNPDKDIIIDDLPATLEAHRATNKASIIRKRWANANEPTSQTYIRPFLFPLANPYNQAPATVKKLALDQSQAPSVSDNISSAQERPGTAQSDNAESHVLAIKQWTMRPITSRTTQRFSIDAGKEWREKCEISEQSPWLALMIDIGGDGLTRLHHEILAYEGYMNLKSHELMAYNSLVAEAKSITKGILPSATLELIGSYSTGLASPMSDVDLRISLPSYEKDPLTRGPSATRPKSVRAGQRALESMKQAFIDSGSFDGVEIIPGSIAIVDAVHRPTKLVVQVQAGASHPASLRYTTAYLSEFPTLRPLYIVLRSALQIQGLNTVFTGGLGSYPLLIMIVCALKSCAAEFPKHDVANHLLYILKFYKTLDCYKHGLTLEWPYMFDKRKTGLKHSSMAKRRGIDMLARFDPRRVSRLCLQDPADPENDLGCRSYGIQHVQKTFSSARRKIMHAMREWEVMSEKDRQNSTLGCLHSLLGANYSQFEARRKFVQERMRKASEVKHELSNEFGSGLEILEAVS